MEFSDELLCSDESEVWEDDGDKARDRFREDCVDVPAIAVSDCECTELFIVVEDRRFSDATWSISESLQVWEQYGPPSVCRSQTKQ